MRQSYAYTVVFTIALVGLSGCALPPPAPTPTPTDTDEGTAPFMGWAMTIKDFPETIVAGEPAMHKIDVQGEGQSDHIGAHFGLEPSQNPSTTVYPFACSHVEVMSSAPGQFMVPCTFPENGTYYIRAHARTTEDGVQTNHWGREHMIVVPTPPSFQVTVADVPTTVAPASTFHINVTITGEHNTISDHLGAHFGYESAAAGSVVTYPVACDHHEDGKTVPGGPYTVTCTVPDATQSPIYLRGHMRFTAGDSQYSFWSEEQTIAVA